LLNFILVFASAQDLVDLLGDDFRFVGLVVGSPGLLLLLSLDVLLDFELLLLEVAIDDPLLLFLVVDVHDSDARVLDGGDEAFGLGLPAILLQELRLQLLLLLFLLQLLLA
jgi:hypothetical protein